MHVENELAKIVTVGAHEFEEIIKEYEEEILMQEEVPEPPRTDLADTVPAQGKPWCITSYFFIITEYIYLWCVFTLQAFYGKPPA